MAGQRARAVLLLLLAAATAGAQVEADVNPRIFFPGPAGGEAAAAQGGSQSSRGAPASGTRGSSTGSRQKRVHTHVTVKQHCHCPRSLKAARAAYAKVAGDEPGFDPDLLGREAMDLPICTQRSGAATAGAGLGAGQGEEQERAAAEQARYYAAVAAVCPIRKQVIDLRRSAYCDAHAGLQRLLAGAELEVEHTKLKIKHTAQVSQDKSTACAAAAAEEGASPPPRRLSRNAKGAAIAKVEVELAKRRALVEILPAVLVVETLRERIWSARHADAMFYTAGDAAGLRAEMEGADAGRRLGYLDEVAQRLPQEQPRVAHTSCAVVGNAGVLKLFKHGPMIDQHDLVIRINQGPDGGPHGKPSSRRFAKQVGTRTDVRILNRKWTELYSSLYGYLTERDQPNATYWATRADVKYIKYLGDRLRSRRENATLLWMTNSIQREGHALLAAAREGIQEGLGLKFRGGNSPSSGFIALHTALQVCDKVNVFGFTIGNCYGQCMSKDNYHYFDKKDAPDREMSWHAEAHSFALEGAVLKALHVLGILCIVPPPVGLGFCGARLNGALDDLKAQSAAGSLNLTALLADEKLIAKLNAYPPGMDPLAVLSSRGSGRPVAPRSLPGATAARLRVMSRNVWRSPGQGSPAGTGPASRRPSYHPARFALGRRSSRGV
eukprot:jgi/Tetstr1/440926/TSEL_029196.t2